MICMEEPCQCHPKKKSAPKKSVAKSKPLIQAEDTTPSEIPAPTVDLKAAMKSAALSSGSMTQSAVSPSMVEQEAVLGAIREAAQNAGIQQLLTLDSEMLTALATLFPILHPDETAPYRKQIWQERRRLGL